MVTRIRSSPHFLCSGCSLMLPHRSFSMSQLKSSNNDGRLCRNCVGTMWCRLCQTDLPVTDFSMNVSRGGKSHCCNFCRSKSKTHQGPVSGGSRIFWRWAVAVNRVLRSLPDGVQHKVFQYVCGVGGFGGMVELGEFYACAICDLIREHKVESMARHCGGRQHRTRAAAWNTSRAIAEECVAAAKEAGIPLGASNYSSHDVERAMRSAVVVASEVGAAGASNALQCTRRWGRR